MYVPLVINNKYNNYNDYYTPSVINPYFVSTMGPIRKNVSSLGTAANDLIFSPVSNILAPVSNILSPVSNILSPVSNILSPVSNILSPTITLSDSNIALSMSYNQPMIANEVQYLNINNDPDLIRKVSKYFFEKTMNSWMYSDFEDLLMYLVVKNDKVQVISNKKELDNNKKDNDMKSIEMKVNYIADNVMTKYDMKSFLKKYAIKSGLDLWKLKENKSYVKKSLYKKIHKKLQKLVFHS